jgi:hypothetical protein
MKFVKVLGCAALVLVGVVGWLRSANAASWRYSGPVGGAPACGASGGSDMACDGFICEPFDGISCTSGYALSVPPGTILCYCTDTQAGC